MKKFKAGLQLFSVREEMSKDMDATLKAVKEMGYDYVEFAGFFDRSAQEIKAILNKYELTAISAHHPIQEFQNAPKETIEFFKEIGIKYAVIPWFPADNLKGTENWEKTVAEFTEYGKVLKENGIQLLYHNHDFEFNKFEGKYLLDWIYEEISPELLKPQIDTCWVHYAGENPSEYIKRYSGRMDTIHLKDFVCKGLGNGPVYDLIGKKDDNDAKEDTGFRLCPVGYGVQDFPEILDVAGKAGVEYVIVEQDVNYETPALENARLSREYLKTLGI